jgi:hypothetical protein
MLSSQKEEQQFKKPQDLSPLSSTTRFDNILGSIRHIAQDIDLDEIVAADNNVNQLVEKLLSLEKQVLTLTEIRRRLNRVGVNGSKSEHEMSLQDSAKVPTQAARMPKLIPFPGTVKPIAPLSAVEADPPAGITPAAADSVQPAVAKPKPSEQPKIVNPTTASSQVDHSPSPPRGSAPLPLPAKAKEVTQSRLMEREFPVWEKNPITTEPQEVSVMESTLSAETHLRAARHESPASEQKTSQRISPTGGRAKEKGKYQVTYSFVDKRANFDQRLRELVKTYGEVDIYSDNDAHNRKRNLKRTAIVAFVLVAAFSVFPGGASLIGNFQRGQFNRPEPSPASESFTPKVSSSLVAATLPLAETDDLSTETKPMPIPAKQRKLPRKTEQVESLTNPLFNESSARNEEIRKQEISGQQSAVGGQ